MLAIIGMLVVMGAVVVGYLMEHGKLTALFQPAELVIIGGAAVATILVAIANARGGAKGIAEHDPDRGTHRAGSCRTAACVPASSFKCEVSPTSICARHAPSHPA